MYIRIHNLFILLIITFFESNKIRPMAWYIEIQKHLRKACLLRGSLLLLELKCWISQLVCSYFDDIGKRFINMDWINPLVSYVEILCRPLSHRETYRRLDWLHKKNITSVRALVFISLWVFFRTLCSLNGWHDKCSATRYTQAIHEGFMAREFIQRCD